MPEIISIFSISDMRWQFLEEMVKCSSPKRNQLRVRREIPATQTFQAGSPKGASFQYTNVSGKHAPCSMTQTNCELYVIQNVLYEARQNA